MPALDHPGVEVIARGLVLLLQGVGDHEGGAGGQRHVRGSQGLELY